MHRLAMSPKAPEDQLCVQGVRPLCVHPQDPERIGGITGTWWLFVIKASDVLPRHCVPPKETTIVKTLTAALIKTP